MDLNFLAVVFLGVFLRVLGASVVFFILKSVFDLC